MKKLYTTLIAIFAIFYACQAQNNVGSDTTAIGLGATSNDPAYKFSYEGKSVAHYGLGWYQYPNSSSPPTAYLSGYQGIKFFTAGTVRGTWDSSGNFGIGTTSPLAPLEISTALDVNLRLGNGAANSVFTYDIGRNGTDGMLHFYGNQSGFNGYVFGGTDGEEMRITPSGNISIGTSDPQGYKLAVNGSAIAESVTVKLHGNWPDFVFKPKYNLLPLTDVKAFIDINQHLPDMPSEAELMKDGINLGEIIKLQTKKIEELTLYAIEQQKKLDKQETRMAALEKTLLKLNNNK